MIVTHVIGKSTAARTGSGGAWGDESTGMLGVGLPGTVRHELYAARDFVKETAQDASNTAFSMSDFLQGNWKLLSVGAVALLVLLKD